MFSKGNNHTAIRLLCLLGGMLAPLVCQAIGDYGHYLQQMETEARRSAATLYKNEANSTSAVTSDLMAPDAAFTRERLPLGLQQDAFEAILRKEFLGTFTFYQKLSSDDKLHVFKRYQQDNRISTIREETLKLL